jgi:hypothetical protein
MSAACQVTAPAVTTKRPRKAKLSRAEHEAMLPKAVGMVADGMSRRGRGVPEGT